MAEKMSPRIVSCQKQSQQIFDNSLIKEKDTTKKPSFIQDEKKALEILAAIDLNKLTIDTDRSLNKLLLDHCSNHNIAKFIELNRTRPSCNNIFKEYAFYNALTYAIDNYKWSKKTKQQSKESIFSFIDYQANHNAPLINLLVSMSLMKHMLEKQIINKKHTKLIQGSYINAERDSLRLRGSYRKLMGTTKIINCENYRKYKIIEDKITSDVSDKINSILKVLKN